MQSFKQFIKEGSKDKSDLVYTLGFYNEKIPNFNHIKEYINQELSELIDKTVYCEYYANSNVLHVYIKLNFDNYDLFFFREIDKKITEYVQDFLNKKNLIPKRTLDINNIIPENIFIECPSITYNATKVTTLHNIDKQIGCSYLFIASGKIKDSVLGLLKIKTLEELNFPLMRNENHWEEIIIRHLKDKNILKCQKELIQNGFKDYAKL